MRKRKPSQRRRESRWSSSLAGGMENLKGDFTSSLIIINPFSNLLFKPGCHIKDRGTSNSTTPHNSTPWPCGPNTWRDASSLCRGDSEDLSRRRHRRAHERLFPECSDCWPYPLVCIPVLQLSSRFDWLFNCSYLNRWMFEKYDGVRAFWNPSKKQFYSRRGNLLSLPQEIVDSMPTDMFLDGELW